MTICAMSVNSIIAATYSRVDGRDLLAELKLNKAHFVDIHVRIDGQWKVYEGDWLKRLMKARDEYLSAADAAIDQASKPPSAKP